jgi:glutamate/tyrosine decarboxylase-like PLP-dependent enzyme
MRPFKSVFLEANTSETQWICSPACTELEAVVMDWAAKLFGLSKEFHNTTQAGGGVIQVSRTACLSYVPEDQ